MSAFQLPDISVLPSLSTTERASILDALFEKCPELHTLSVELLRTQTFQSYSDLIASVGAQLTDLAESPSTSDTEWLDKILGAHPRLGEKKIETVSAASKAEQAQLNSGGEEEATKLRGLNEEYERTFPGLKYVVFVNGRSRSVVMENMRSRIDRGDITLERTEGIKAMCDIAADRAVKLQSQ